MLSQVINKLKVLGATTFPKAKEADISKTNQILQENGFAILPDDYISLINISDGFIWDSVEVYGINKQERENYTFNDIASTNISLIQFKFLHKRLVIGRSSENIIIYCPNKKQYLLIDRVTNSIKQSFNHISDFFISYFDNVL